MIYEEGAGGLGIDLPGPRSTLSGQATEVTRRRKAYGSGATATLGERGDLLLTSVMWASIQFMKARLDVDQVTALWSWLDRHAGHAIVVTDDSDEPVVGLIFDCESDGEEIYLGSFEAGGFAGEVVVLGE